MLQIKKVKLTNYAIPVMAFAGLGAIGILAINQDVSDDASAANESALTSTISYNDEYITISNSATIDLGAASVSAESSYIYATDNVTVSTNVASGYDLYLSSADTSSAALTTSGSYTQISATSGTGGDSGTPAALDADSYGYAVPSSLINNTNFDSSYASPSSSSKFAAVPAGTQDRIRSTNTANESGDTIDVHYGANVTNYLAPGVYTGKVVYSAVVTPSDTVTATVSPTSGASGTILTITSGPKDTISTAHSLDPSEVNISFRQSGKTKGYCTTTSADPSSGHLVTTCAVQALPSGTYDVVITVPRFGFTDTISDGFTSTSSATSLNTTMQNSNISSICSSLSETTSTSSAPTYEITDARNSERYYIRKFTFGGTAYCMMVENLYLEGSTKITSSDSNVSSNYTLPTSTTTGYYTSNTAAQMYDGANRYRYIGSGNSDGSYYNWCAATAGTGGCYNQNTNSSNGVTEATSSICPKGWRLPTYTEQQSIDSRIDSIGINTFFANAAGGTNAPIYVGNYYNSALNNAGSNVGWWSSTQSNASVAYYLYASSGALDTSIRNKYLGSSVRCLVAAS